MNGAVSHSHPAGVVLLSDVDPGQSHDPEVSHRGFYCARMIESGVSHRLPRRGVHDTPWIGESPGRWPSSSLSCDLLSLISVFSSFGSGAGQPSVWQPCEPISIPAAASSQTSSADTSGRARTLIPLVGPAQQARNDVHGRREVMPLQNRQRCLQQPNVTIVEGKTDESALTACPHRVDQRSMETPCRPRGSSHAIC